MHERRGAMPPMLARPAACRAAPRRSTPSTCRSKSADPVQRKAAEHPRRSLIAASPRGNDSAKEVQIMICSA